MIFNREEPQNILKVHFYKYIKRLTLKDCVAHHAFYLKHHQPALADFWLDIWTRALGIMGRNKMCIHPRRLLIQRY